jgi:hypothetical protein
VKVEGSHLAEIIQFSVEFLELMDSTMVGIQGLEHI